jgi:hypothetical protein
MKRIATVVILCLLAFSTFTSVSDAQRRRTRGRARAAAPSGKVAIPCPSPLRDINDCPDTGCGLSLDPHLNRQKNIRSDDREPVTKTILDLKKLPDPVPGYKIGDTREKLTALGEGQMIIVVAHALVARKGGGESCNCKLLSVADTDNHIVLVDRVLRRKKGETAKALMHRRELASITAEFAPRPRLDVPELTRANLQSLIAAAPGQALKVRITGLLMFDSEHSLGHHLKRHNNWEIHPVLELEYCPKSKKCTADSDDNWTFLGEEP